MNLRKKKNANITYSECMVKLQTLVTITWLTVEFSFKLKPIRMWCVKKHYLLQSGLNIKEIPCIAFSLVSDQMNIANSITSRKGVRTRFTLSIVLTPLRIDTLEHKWARNRVSSGQYDRCKINEHGIAFHEQRDCGLIRVCYIIHTNLDTRPWYFASVIFQPFLFRFNYLWTVQSCGKAR